MALEKEVKQPDGVVTSYHRIVRLDVTVNIDNTLEVCSYVDKESRDKEKENQNNPIDEYIPVYARNRFITIDYNENMSIKEAYEYLKTLPEFEGAIDV